MKLSDLITQAAVCRERYLGLTRMYENEGAIEGLFQWTMNFPELKSSIEKTSEKSIEATAEAGVDTGPIVSLFVKLKAGIGAKGKLAEATKTIASEDNRLALLGVAEAWLGSNGLLTTDPSRADPPAYFRFTDAFSAYPPGSPEEEERLVKEMGPEHGPVALKRWRIDARLHHHVNQFVYARPDPPIAAVLIVPRNEDQRIAGTSNAAYDGFGSRICFGKFGGLQGGVRFVDVMYYVADGPAPAP